MSLVLYPSTAEDVLSQFVRLTLTLTLASQVSGQLTAAQCAFLISVVSASLSILSSVSPTGFSCDSSAVIWPNL